MEASAAKSEKTDLSPPYAPFRTVRTLIERMESEGDLPARLDRSYLSNIPWSAQNELMQACRSLGLIDANDVPTNTLKDLVHNPDQRKGLFGEILKARYPNQMALGTNATQDQLAEVFKQGGSSGSTLTKAMRFYLQAANYAEIELSKLFKTPKAESTPRKTGKKRGGKKPEGAESDPSPPKPPPPEDDAPDLIRNLLKQLPPEGAKWERAKAKVWLSIAENTFDLVYRWAEDDPKSKARTKTASPAPEAGGEA